MLGGGRLEESGASRGRCRFDEHAATRPCKRPCPCKVSKTKKKPFIGPQPVAQARQAFAFAREKKAVGFARQEAALTLASPASPLSLARQEAQVSITGQAAKIPFSSPTSPLPLARATAKDALAAGQAPAIPFAEAPAHALARHSQARRQSVARGQAQVSEPRAPSRRQPQEVEAVISEPEPGKVGGEKPCPPVNSPSDLLPIAAGVAP